MPSQLAAGREAPDWLLVVKERHLRCILKEYVEHYNRARSHRSLDLRPPTGDLPLGDRDSPSHRDDQAGWFVARVQPGRRLTAPQLSARPPLIGSEPSLALKATTLLLG